jgi:sugar lactone lactonase YvrE
LIAACILAIAACETPKGERNTASDRKQSATAQTAGAPPSTASDESASAGSGDGDETFRTIRHADPDLANEHRTRNLKVSKTFGEAMPTGVTVSSEGRMFVNFPRWGDEPKATVVEVEGGQKEPYPSAEMNDMDADEPESHLLSVQSVRVGPNGRLWILDTGRPRFQPRIEGGAKLVAVDLETDDVVETIVLPDDVALEKSYLNDVRFDLTRGEEGMAYITDSSGAGRNGIVVVDLASGESWRRLHEHEAVQAESNFTPIVEGQSLMRRPAEGEPSHMTVGSDGIALGADGERLYFRPLSGRGLYSVSVDALSNRDRSDEEVADTLRDHGDLGFASDGLEADDEGRIYLTNYEDNAVMRWSPESGRVETLVHHPQALWPDTLALVDGELYFTANQLHRQAGFQGGKDERKPPYPLFVVDVDAAPVRLAE